MVLRVDSATIGKAAGVYSCGYSVGDNLVVTAFSATEDLDALGDRFKNRYCNEWPNDYRFQVAKRSWRAHAREESGNGGIESFVLQIAINPEERTPEKICLDIADAADVSVYAGRFNGFLKQQCEDQMPALQVAAPIGCTVMETCFPAMIPIGTVCTLTPFPLADVQKFLFSGKEPWLEIVHLFFHYAAFTTNAKDFVCDLQGAELDNGNLLLIDPAVWRTTVPGVDNIVRTAAQKVREGAHIPLSLVTGPTAECFDMLHPKCAQLCQAFDPQRRNARRSAGLCGTSGTCGFRV